MDHAFVPVVITVCCVLHSTCLTAGDINEPIEEDEEIEMPLPHPL